MLFTKKYEPVTKMTDFIGAFKLGVRLDRHIACRLNLWLNSDHVVRPYPTDFLNETLFGTTGEGGELVIPHFDKAMRSTLAHGYAPMVAPHMIQAFEPEMGGIVAGCAPSVKSGVMLVDDAFHRCTWICCTGECSEDVWSWLHILVDTILDASLCKVTGVIREVNGNRYAMADGHTLTFGEAEPDKATAPTYVKEVKRAIAASEKKAAKVAPYVTRHDIERFYDGWVPTKWCLSYQFPRDCKVA